MSSRYRLILFGFILFLSACFSAKISPSEKLSYIVSYSVSCSAPCWNSLVPGVSTETDFRRVINGAPAFAFSDLRYQRFEDDEINTLWTNEDVHFGGGIFFRNGVVEHIRFQILQNDLAIDMVLDQLGDPDGYEATELENEYIELTLFFEEHGVVVNAWFEHSLTELRNITRACEYEPDWHTAPKRLEIALVEPASIDLMAEKMNWLFFTRNPKPWDDIEALALTQPCP